MSAGCHLRVFGTPTMVQLHALQERDGVYLSANGRLASLSKAAWCNSEHVANLCIALWLDRLNKRFGTTVRITLEAASSYPEHSSGHDDAILLIARARSACFAPNRKPNKAAIREARLEVELLRFA